VRCIIIIVSSFCVCSPTSSNVKEESPVGHIPTYVKTLEKDSKETAAPKDVLDEACNANGPTPECTSLVQHVTESLKKAFVVEDHYEEHQEPHTAGGLIDQREGAHRKIGKAVSAMHKKRIPEMSSQSILPGISDRKPELGDQQISADALQENDSLHQTTGIRTRPKIRDSMDPEIAASLFESSHVRGRAYVTESTESEETSDFRQQQPSNFSVGGQRVHTNGSNLTHSTDSEREAAVHGTISSKLPEHSLSQHIRNSINGTRGLMHVQHERVVIESATNTSPEVLNKSDYDEHFESTKHGRYASRQLGTSQWSWHGSRNYWNAKLGNAVSVLLLAVRSTKTSMKEANMGDLIVVLLILTLFVLGGVFFVMRLQTMDKEEEESRQGASASLLQARRSSTAGSGTSPMLQKHMPQIPPSHNASPLVPPKGLSTVPEAILSSNRQVPESPVIRDSVHTFRFPFLCAELVVPEESECTLLVPLLNMSGTGTPPEVTVDDTRGIAVFRATMSGGDVNGSRVTRSQEGMRLVLSSVQGDAILAYSRVVKCGRGQPETLVAIHHHSNALFGELRQDAGGFNFMMATTWGPKQVKFRREAQSITAIDETQRMMAIAETLPENLNTRSVRIGPLVDAGFIVLALFGIDMLES